MVPEETTQDDIQAGHDWISYRPAIKVLDCTIRDGGLMNNHYFPHDLVRTVFEANAAAGTDYMELGYKADTKIFSVDENGPWKFCSEDDIQAVVGETESNLKLSVMADAERTDYDRDILPADESPLDLIRVATYIHQLPVALDMVKDAHNKGYETCVNLMAISAIPEYELDKGLELIAQSEVDVMYLVDSFGSLYSEQIHHLVRKYLDFMQPQGKQVGMHTHNNMQLAFANTVEGLIEGANYLDGSMAGLGRGAGNCPLELLLSFLHNPKYHLRPMLRCIQESIEPMRAELKWGPSIPYMLTAMLNEHPRAAMKHNTGDTPDDVVSFYDELTLPQ